MDSSRTDRSFAGRGGLITAGLFGASAIICGAWAAHGLQDWLLQRDIDAATVVKRVDQFEVAARYHLVHAVALLGLAAFSDRLARAHYRGIVVMWAAGTLLFSGSLYLLVLTNTTWLGAITPLGGLCWIVAWLWLAVAGWRLPR